MIYEVQFPRLFSKLISFYLSCMIIHASARNCQGFGHKKKTSHLDKVWRFFPNNDCEANAQHGISIGWVKHGGVGQAFEPQPLKSAKHCKANNANADVWKCNDVLSILVSIDVNKCYSQFWYHKFHPTPVGPTEVVVRKSACRLGTCDILPVHPGLTHKGVPDLGFALGPPNAFGPFGYQRTSSWNLRLVVSTHWNTFGSSFVALEHGPTWEELSWGPA